MLVTCLIGIQEKVQATAFFCVLVLSCRQLMIVNRGIYLILKPYFHIIWERIGCVCLLLWVRDLLALYMRLSISYGIILAIVGSSLHMTEGRRFLLISRLSFWFMDLENRYSNCYFVRCSIKFDYIYRLYEPKNEVSL